MGSEHSSQFATAVAHINQLSYYEASYYLVLTSSQLVVKDVTVTSANPSHHKHILKYCFLYYRPTVYCSLLPSMKPKLFSFFFVHNPQDDSEQLLVFKFSGLDGRYC